MVPNPPASETKCSKQGSALELSQNLGAEAGQLPQVQVLGLAPASTEGKQEKERRERKREKTGKKGKEREDKGERDREGEDRGDERERTKHTLLFSSKLWSKCSDFFQVFLPHTQSTLTFGNDTKLASRQRFP